MATTSQPATYDEEHGLLVTESSFGDEAVRKGFIRKVYAILITMLTLTFAIVILFTGVPTLRQWGQSLTALVVLVVLWITIFVLLIVLICNESLRRTHPTNIILLAAFTLLMSFALGITATQTKPFIVLIAVGITLAITIALTLFAFQTKYDFTVFSGILFCFLISLLLFGFLVIIFRSRILYLVYATLGALIISCYIVIDTQMMMSGKTVSLSPEEYIFAALNLYIDVVTLFSFILALGNN